MKLVAQSRGIEKLREIRSEFAAAIRDGFEHRAKPCSACADPGVCCRDAHFVNVRITRLEAAAMVQALDGLGPGKKEEILQRAGEVVGRFGLTEGGVSAKTYACPLFEKGVGCLVHDSAKPLPCIAHACYANLEELPPDKLLEERELAVGALNRRVYGREESFLPIPLALERTGKRSSGPTGPAPPEPVREEGRREPLPGPKG